VGGRENFRQQAEAVSAESASLLQVTF